MREFKKAIRPTPRFSNRGEGAILHVGVVDAKNVMSFLQ